MKQERTRVANRMNGLRANQGLWLPPGTDIGAAAKTVRLWDGSPMPAALRARLEREWARTVEDVVGIRLLLTR